MEFLTDLKIYFLGGISSFRGGGVSTRPHAKYVLEKFFFYIFMYCGLTPSLGADFKNNQTTKQLNNYI